LLGSHGINPTHQRIQIAHVLFASKKPLSADNMMTFVNQHCAETSKVTVYNTLNLFLRKRLTREVIVDPSKVLYDPDTEPHYYIYDVIAGQLTAIDANEISLPSVPALPEGMISEGVDVIVRIRPAG
jgi:Fur family iron response transcriptional regulator